METCEQCGNEYDKTFTIITARGNKYVFDCMECAIQQLAPACEHCENRILGHGIEVDGRYFCCAHCARQRGAGGVKDRVDRIGAARSR